MLFTYSYVIVIYPSVKMDLNKIIIIVKNVEFNHCCQTF